jgi:hypothetical protein
MTCAGAAIRGQSPVDEARPCGGFRIQGVVGLWQASFMKSMAQEYR